LTDKTGTLTQNDMIFKKLSLENQNYTYEDVEDITKKLRIQCEIYNGPIGDLQKLLDKKNPSK